MFTYTIDARLGVVELIGPSPDTAEEFIAVLRRALADPDFQPAYSILRDRSGMAPPSPEYMTSVVRLMAALPAPALQSVCYAVVAGGMRDFAALLRARKDAEGSWIDIQVFDSRAEALAWLRHVCKPAA